MNFSSENFTESEHRKIFWRRLARRVFLEDWLVKVIALAISLTLWFVVSGFRAPISKSFKEITLNLSFSNNFEITNSPPKEVGITVTGDKRKIDQLRDADLVLSVDLTDVKPGDQIIQLTPDNVSIELPSGVKLDEVQPNKIAVRLERVDEREVEVKVATEGSVADGFEIYNQTVVPQKVRVRGAESFIKSLDSVTTEKINLENRQQDFTARQIGSSVVNPNITVLDGIVDVVFKIGEKRSERILMVPVTVENKNEKATVLLYGARSVLENIHAEDLKIEMKESEAGGIVPQLVLPPEIQDKIEIRQIKLPK